jgi:hypothetical protein
VPDLVGYHRKKETSMPPNTESDVGQLALGETQHVLRRFFIRSLFVLFLPFVLQIEFWSTVAMLMFIGGFSCTWVAFLREEPVHGPSLTSWDEAAWHYSLFFLLMAANKAVTA